jgi:MtaA/CmuA family methyltransferase
MTSLERTLATLHGAPRDHLAAMPITMIYAAQLEGVSYADYVQDYRVLARCQLRIVDQFAIDTVTVCSDPYRETADIGAELTFMPDAPPRANFHVLSGRSPVTDLHRPDPLGGGRMTDRIRGVELLRDKIGGLVPITGWVEGPIAEAVDLRGMTELMTDLADAPEWVEDLFAWITEIEIAFGVAQVQAGAEIIGMGDAAASLISPRIYESLVLPHEKQIVAAIHEAGGLVRLHICGNTNHLLPHMAKTGADIIDLDYLVDFTQARPQLGPEPVILGHFDPVAVLLQGTPTDVSNACTECHALAGERYIVGPGCEVPPGTPRENMEAMFSYAASHR